VSEIENIRSHSLWT